MPRFTLTAQEQKFLGQALAAEARERKLGELDSLVRAANTTPAELRTLVVSFLNAAKAERQTRFAAIDAEAAAQKATLTAEIAVIDSALAKL